MTIDYRGFGLSSGFPTESGLILDGIATVNWALHIAQIPADRIVLIGQSLGTAVTTAVAKHFVEEGTEFAGVILVAGFMDLTSLLTSYAIAGYLPVISPLRHYPKLYKMFSERLVDTWQTSTRLATLVRLSQKLRLFIIHGRNDYEIPYSHSDGLFAAAANATTDGGMDIDLLMKIKARSTVDLGDGAFISTWKAGGGKTIREEIIAHGRMYYRTMTCTRTHDDQLIEQLYPTLQFL